MAIFNEFSSLLIQLSDSPPALLRVLVRVTISLAYRTSSSTSRQVHQGLLHRLQYLDTEERKKEREPVGLGSRFPAAS